jgi:putative MATE family efflux protein
MDRKPRKNLLDAPVGRTILELAWPMVFGMAAVILFNVVDTFYVGRLGATELAAMSFTFPVVFLVMSIAMGMGVGVTSVISRVIGEGDFQTVRRITTDGLILANAIVVVVAVGGLFTIEPLFGALGASPDLVVLIRQYMIPWYLGIGFIVIPMVGNSAIRATGDTRTPALIMMIAGGVNIVLDPLLIFGPGPFPRLELQGAAIATLLSYSITFVAAVWILDRREHMLTFARPRVAEVLDSWRRILYVAIPAGFTSSLLPIANGIFTRMVSHFGAEAVAAYGVATRIEALSLIGTHALFAAVAPFVGQNYGARRIGRVGAALGFSVKASLVYGAVLAVVLAAFARPLSALFSAEPAIVATSAHYLWIVPVSYGLLGDLYIVNAMFHAVNQPYKSAFIIVLRLFVFGVPLAYFLSLALGVNGIFAGLAIGNVIVGVIALALARRFLREAAASFGPAEAPTAAEPAVGGSCRQQSH